MYADSVKLLRILFVVSIAIGASLFLYTSRYDSPPRIRTFLDRNGQFIGTLDPAYQGIKIWTPLSDLPRHVVEKTIQNEDRFFYWHKGINPFSTFKAAIQNLRAGRVVRGGSTITQQLAKNLIWEKEGVLPARSFWHKIREVIVALGLELRHDKSWILERYLNTVYYGHHAYGVAAAADVYFAKKLSELTESEIETLTSLPKAPGRVGMQVSKSLSSGRHFIEYVDAKSPRFHPPYRIATTLDLKLEESLENIAKSMLTERSVSDPRITAAIAVIDVKTGDVLAMVGSRDYFDQSIDGAVNAAVAPRQPGSTLKPFTYFAAFAKGFNPNSIVPDEPLSFEAKGFVDVESYAPQNFDRRFHGNMTIKNALANSYNVPAVVTLNEIGLSYYHDLLKKFGFTTLQKPPQHYGLAVTLGSGEVTLLELTNAYAALARGGIYRPYRIIKRNDYGDATPVVANAAQFASEVTSILSDEHARLKAFGFNESMTIEGHTVAVKTGTSYEYHDNWAIGYSPSYAVGVWVGHADGSPMDKATATTGATGAAPVWHAVMETLLRGTQPENFPVLVAVKEESDHPHPASPIDGEVRRQPRSLLRGAIEWKIISPLSNTTYRIHSYLPIDHQKILAKIDAKKDIELDWYLDGNHLESTTSTRATVWIYPVPGRHKLSIESQDGRSQEISFTVLDSDMENRGELL